ncbi:MAG: hypothetical protein H7Y59_07805 [Anaerolineales bacterium]|nr:hypothetical protein [Anaerolineales bacterium]
MFGKLFGNTKPDDLKDALEATAEVLSIEDTGGRMGSNPVVLLKLRVQPSAGTAFETTSKCMVSIVAVPRVGDKIKIKYSSADPTQIVVI